MNIVVCLKQIPDPEVPFRGFKIDPVSKKPVQGSAKQVMDSFGEYALEVAVQLKEKVPGTQITALCLGDKPADEVMRMAFALTADKAVRVWDTSWTDLDVHAIAHILAQAIKKQGGADLVLVGRQAGDIERGMVGTFLANELGVGSTSVVARVELVGDKIRLWREVEDGLEVIESSLPSVASITNDETNVPRLPKVKNVMQSVRKPITVLSAGDLELNLMKLQNRIELKDLYVPALESQCEIIEGEDGPGKAVCLTKRLRELKLLG